ncbi:hypothetical protein GMSM_25780 [Geomonas sp. Red276]
MVKRTFSIPDEKEVVYERFKEIVPEVSGALMEMIEGYVRRHEAQQKSMEAQRVFKGKHNRDSDVFTGQEFRFFGTVVDSDTDDNGTVRTVFYTKKGKFLVYAVDIVDDIESMGFSVYENYEEMAVKIPRDLLMKCQEKLSLSSNVRTYIELDV